ncbi:MAG: ABC transporter ATP-binding protein, partial [Fimbriimonadaceae bacterium]|nr:ABC transporter ATP-binding protein [Fimbriimonadaceae bacterium]
MSDLALSVRGLTKEYQILHNAERHNRVTDAVADSVKGLFRKKEVETFRALDDVSFDVKKGEVLGVIGRNGAGKSTLLKILSRITEPTSGEVHVYGRVGSLLEVGTGFHPELTGRENIYLNGAILGMRRREIDRQFDAIVDFAEVEKFLDTPVKRYSSGMYVRLAFAVAAHLNPEILIVDEVLAVGDAQFQKKCLGKMQDVSRQDGRTVLFVSHNMAAIKALCTKALYLAKGSTLMTGDSESVVTHYLASTHADTNISEMCNNQGVHIKQLGIRSANALRFIKSLPAYSDYILECEVGFDKPNDKVAIQLEIIN